MRTRKHACLVIPASWGSPVCSVGSPPVVEFAKAQAVPQRCQYAPVVVIRRGQREPVEPPAIDVSASLFPAGIAYAAPDVECSSSLVNA
jgi:hypothetical protein